MSSVIKSTYTRVTSPTKPVIREAKDIRKKENDADKAGGAGTDAQAEERELKEAYNELIIAAQEEVALIFEDARKKVEEMKAAARDEIEESRAKILDEAHSEAYEKGFSEGMANAEEQAAKILDNAEKEANALLSKAYEERDRLLDGSEKQILGMSLKIAGKILKTELEQNDSAYMSMVTNAIRNIKSENHITLRVNPGDYVRHFKSRETEFSTENGSITANVINDPAIPYGGCLIETESGAVDAGADTQLAQLASIMELADF